MKKTFVILSVIWAGSAPTHKDEKRNFVVFHFQLVTLIEKINACHPEAQPKDPDDVGSDDADPGSSPQQIG